MSIFISTLIFIFFYLFVIIFFLIISINNEFLL